uniref:Putative reverse transcriptase n=1 Tax=Ixodes ricinus TaxID=34613 RepID=A0A6B0VDB5_IXORI
MELPKLMACGKELGLKGAALKEWVDQERENTRAARAQEQERSVEAEHRTLELRIRLQELQNASPIPVTTSFAENGTGTTLWKSPQRWLPTFDEKKDDLDAYLLRFERLASGQMWPREHWATALSVCLAGEALGVFSRLTPEDSVEYDNVKKALLQRFRLTADGFRDKFRSAKPEKGETGTQYAARLSSLFDRWVDLSGTAKDVAALRNLLLTEQFVWSVPSKMSLFLRERKSKQLGEMADLADRYLEAQEQEPARREEATSDSAASGSRPTSNGQQNKASKLLRKCFLCGRSGHLAAQCKNGQKPSSQAGTCRNCGKFGHTSSQCWNRDGGSQVSGVQATREELDAVSGRVKGGYVELRDGTKVPVVNAVSGTSRLMGDMPAAAGRLHGQAVTVLRDTGCNTVVVRRSLVPDDNLTGTSNLVYLADGTARVLPEARVHVETPFYSGNVVAKCMENPLYDLILGNLPNVRAPSEPEAGWNRPEKTEVGLPHDEKQDVEIRATAATEPRSKNQAAKKNATLLKVQVSEGVPEKPEELATLQKEDSSLNLLFDRVRKISSWRNSEGPPKSKRDVKVKRTSIGKAADEVVKKKPAGLAAMKDEIKEGKDVQYSSDGTVAISTTGRTTDRCRGEARMAKNRTEPSRE